MLKILQKSQKDETNSRFKNARNKRFSLSLASRSFGEVCEIAICCGVVAIAAILRTSCALGGEPKRPAQNWTSTSTKNERPNSTTSLKPLETVRSGSLDFERAIPLKSDVATNDARVRALINEGDLWLSKKRWFDAKKAFEKALRERPSDPAVKARFAEARRRGEIETRYQDGTFGSLTKDSSLEDQLAIFDEVFLDVDIYYVDRPKYSELFSLGIAGVGEALGEDSFYLQNNVPIELKSQAQTLFNSLRRTIDGWTIETEDDVRRSVFWTAKQLRRRIGIPESAVISEFLCSTICSLDAYSSPLTPLQVDDVFSMIDGRFVGLGVELKTDRPTKIVRVIPNSPAEESGVQVGDEIVRIDGRSTDGLTGAEIGNLLQGLEGESISLALRSSNGKLRETTAIRRPIEAPSVENARALDSKGEIGYLKISCFQKTTSEELSKALAILEKKGVKSLVVDLRQNPGGLLQEAINVSDLFLDRGAIVQTRGRTGFRSYAAGKTRACSLPLTLIVDSGSASAAEIFAGAIQENGRGLVVGEQSYGKGTVQAIVQLTGETKSVKPVAGLRLTTEKFYSPKGRAYAGIGVTPDVNVWDAIPKPVESNRAYADFAETDNEELEVAKERKTPSETSTVYRAARPIDQTETDPFLRIAVREARKSLIARNREQIEPPPLNQFVSQR